MDHPQQIAALVTALNEAAQTLTGIIDGKAYPAGKLLTDAAETIVSLQRQYATLDRLAELVASYVMVTDDCDLLDGAKLLREVYDAAMELKQRVAKRGWSGVDCDGPATKLFAALPLTMPARAVPVQGAR